ncbi:hypothetical protein PUN28_008264 [Cardiocondyla obscurior]|uniref:Uncharacterized protein n=1 Tax=Cardiocondyla obscurior TaxID=286306 RepID=A0AAW2FYD6_9HYME
MYPVNNLTANCQQFGTKQSQTLTTNSVPSGSSIDTYFARKACLQNLTAKWHQKASNTWRQKSDGKLSPNSERILAQKSQRQIVVKLQTGLDDKSPTANCRQNLFANWRQKSDGKLRPNLVAINFLLLLFM